MSVFGNVALLDVNVAAKGHVGFLCEGFQHRLCHFSVFEFETGYAADVRILIVELDREVTNFVLDEKRG